MKLIKIIVADDIVINRILIKEILSEFECEITEAPNGKIVIDLLESEKFDLVLLDIEMPVMNGLETVKYIRRNLPEPVKSIPVVALTAHDPNQYFSHFKHAGFDSLITKPYTYLQMKEMFDTLFN